MQRFWVVATLVGVAAILLIGVYAWGTTVRLPHLADTVYLEEFLEANKIPQGTPLFTARNTVEGLLAPVRRVISSLGQ